MTHCSKTHMPSDLPSSLGLRNSIHLVIGGLCLSVSISLNNVLAAAVPTAGNTKLLTGHFILLSYPSSQNMKLQAAAADLNVEPASSCVPNHILLY